MPNANEISFAHLANWLEGHLDEEEARTVEEQLGSASDATRADADWLRAFLNVSSEVELAAPPPEVRERLSRRFESYAEEKREPGFFRRLMATLTFDSAAGTAMAGVRSAGAAGGEAQRQLVYSTDAADVALDIRRRGGKLDLGGQVLPASDEEPGEFSVQLLLGGEEFGIVAADELGEFSFESVPPGVYEVVLSTDEFEITVGPVGLEE